ncbi:MAG: outer membrane protein transport protein [Polyangiaceae bacterium]|nr:outer membrane protein transport protein [Polyangiaceae bacterium]
MRDRSSPRVPASFGAAGVACALLAWGAPSRGAGFATTRFGAEHGNVTETNPFALYYNPGAIAHSDGVRALAVGNVVYRSVSWRHELGPRDAPVPAGAEGATSGEATVSNVFGGPALGVTARLGDFGAGLGFFVPFGGRVRFDGNDAFGPGSTFPMAGDGVGRFHGIRGAVTFAYTTAGVAYAFGPFAIGASGNLILASVESRQARDFGATGTNGVASEGRARLETSGTFGSFGAGALYEVRRDTLWIGASYQAAPGVGAIAIPGTLTNTYQGVTVRYDVKLHQRLPDVVRIGGRWRPSEEVELRLHADTTRWSRLEHQCIGLAAKPCAIDPDGSAAEGTGTIVNYYRGWEDTWSVHLGGSYWLSPGLELNAGSRFETAAVPDTTLDPNLADSDTLSGGAGVRVRVADEWWLGGSYTHLYYFPRDNRGKSVLADPSVSGQTRRPDGGGRYELFVGAVEVGVEAGF